MKRLFGLGSAIALVIVTACVGDQSVDPNLKPDGGTSAEGGAEASSGSGSSSGSSGQADLCGSLMANDVPSCPGIPPNDAPCDDNSTTACCPGDQCVKYEEGKHCPNSQADPFECFAGAHCNDSSNGAFQSRCCAKGTVVDDPARNQCDVLKRLKLEPTDNTTCAQTCTAGTVQLCRIGNDDKIDPRELPCQGNTTCQLTIIAVPHPLAGEPFLRSVGVCR